MAIDIILLNLYCELCYPAKSGEVLVPEKSNSECLACETVSMGICRGLVDEASLQGCYNCQCHYYNKFLEIFWRSS